MLPEPRAVLQQVTDVVHGALDFAELERLGLSPEAVLDFSVNGNPYGPSPLVHDAIANVRIDRYPDRDTLALRRALSQHLDIALEQILVGNGSMELLWLVVFAFLSPSDAVLIIEPTFGEYARAATLMGTHMHAYTTRSEEAFCIDTDAIMQLLHQVRPRVILLCNPNNPTGVYVPVVTIRAWAATLPRSLFVVDEAYLPFASEADSMLSAAMANVLVLRSMTKAHALAGMRLGYAVGHPDILASLRKVHPPWSVNALAQAAGVATLSDDTHLKHSLAQIAQAKQNLVHGLRVLGFPSVPSTTHFFLLKVGNARACRQALLLRGIQVRDCTSFGLPQYIRIATRRPEENAQLLTALAETQPW